MAAPKGCYFGTMLEVDLTSGTIGARQVDEAVYQKYVGGIGLGAYFLYTELPAGTDPLSPANMLCFLPGPLNGTACPAARLNVSFKSPLTGIYGHAQVGGPTGNEIKLAGWDGIILKGRSPGPVFLAVIDGKAELRDAAAIWGKDTFETEEYMKEAIGSPDAKTICIGPAGENGVLFSAMIVDRSRAAARSGGGLVMGSKNLKGVAVLGSKAVPLADAAGFNKAADSLLETARATRRAEEPRRSPGMRSVSCPHCPVRCMKPEGVRSAFEGLTAGPAGRDSVTRCVEYCDAMGMDAFSAGDSIRYAVELARRGLLAPADLDGIDLSRGDGPAVLQALEAIAFKKGKTGALLSLGVKGMGEKIGGDALRYAAQGKGRKTAAREPQDQAVEAMVDSLVMCTFVGGVPLISSGKNPQVICDMLNAGAGWNWTPDTYWTTAKRVITLQRAFNIRELGVSRKDDALPERFKEPLPEGPKKSQAFSEADAKKMQDEYYAFYGWNADGIPTEASLKAYELDFAIADVVKK